MERVAKRPELAQVKSVVVAGDETGWRVAAVIRHGHAPSISQIEEIANELRGKYDLAA